ncbi:DUF4936 family protein [Undibacterium sp. TJN25]|uniref:DUF4936 family protein n=1 Tax=Undibacterium sp. TJN25 TaxID=3413056 RepID=UPI003BF4596B
MSAKMDCYIYYRAEAQHQQQVGQQAGKLLQLFEQAGVATELKRRPEAENGMHTWMEVYKGVPQDFEAQMRAALQHTQLLAVIADGGKRHIEYFMDITPCA